MSLDSPESWIYGLRTVMLVVAFVAFAAALRAARRQAMRDTDALRAQLEQSQVEVRSLSAQVTALGDTLGGALENLTGRFNQTTARAPASSGGGNSRGYETAIRLARGGASVDEIVASCGTTRAEAKLLRRLHEQGEPRRADANATRIA